MNRSYIICLAVGLTACAANAPQSSPPMNNKPEVVTPPVRITSLTFDAKCGVTQPAPIGTAPAESAKGVTPPRIDPRRGLPFPAYPPTALRAGQAGTVYVSALITETGAVERAELQRTSGFVELDNAAMRNARNWQLIPARWQEKPVCMWVTFPVIFKVNDTNAVDSKKK